MSEQMKADPKKVIQLNPERNQSPTAPIVLTRMPAIMHSLRDKARLQLQLLLKDLFEKVDDALFSRADKATSNQDQNLYFDSMREVRIRRRAVEAGFFRNIDIKFAQLFDPNAYKAASSQEDAIPSIDSLSIVKNDELEEMVAMEALVSKANEQLSEPIQHLTLRIDHLVPVKVYQKNNPLGPDAICDAFFEASKCLEIDLKARLVLYKLFENLLLDKLKELVDSLNKMLVEANILVSLKGDAPAKRAPVYGRQSHPGGLTHGGQVTEHYDEQTKQVLDTLRGLLGSNTQAPAAVSGNELATGELLRILSLAQHQQSLSVSNQNQITNLRSVLGDMLRTGDKAAAINQVDDDVINLVSMMFEFILDDRNLAAPMKVLIGRLQIPMVKVAIADKTFFSKGGHPARRLLNEMAMACLGWQESTDAGKRDNLYEKMQEVVSTVINDFEADIGIFERLLIDFRSFLEKEKRRAQILEQRTIDAEDGKAKSERARALVDDELTRIYAGREIPVAANKLLREAWGNVMFITCLKEGTDSQQWQDNCLTARQLVWSLVAPMEKENRQKLLKLVPELLQKLRVGLEGISFSPFETTQLFKQLESLHLTRLRGVSSQNPAAASAVPAPVSVAEAAVKPEIAVKPETAVKPSTVQPESTVKPEAAAKPETAVKQVPAASEVTAPTESVSAVETIAAKVEPGKLTDAQLTELADTALEAANPLMQTGIPEGEVEVSEVIEAEELKADAQHLALVGNITQGTWFEMTGDGGEKFRCRLAAIIRSVGKYIFVNRSGMKVAEESRESLALAIQTKRLAILDDSMLFDRALESVISSLRDKRTLN